MQPLRIFAEAARTIASGQYASIPGITRRDDEWRSLADAFSHMQSQLQQRENRLRENSMRLQAVLGSMVEGVLAVDSRQRVLIANDAACTMLNVDEQELVGNILSELVRIPELGSAVRQTLAHRTATQTEFETAGQPRRILEVRVAPLSEEQESGAALVMHDVTNLRNLETMRRDFATNVSHELKTPLAAIKAYAETLQLGAINDAEANMGFVEQIESQAEVLDAQIRELLQLSELESGRASFDATEIEIRTLLNECRERFLPEADRRQITIEVDAEPGELVVTDAAALQLVLDNLVSNAIRYSRPSGNVQLTGTMRTDDVILEVIDNGIGISQENQERIFERFYRVDRARSRDVGGTGLGLAIVKHTLLALGGAIQVESKLGSGSNFRVILPVQ